MGGEQKSIDYIMKESDFIIVSLSQSAETKGIINKERINSMKPNGIIVNIGRGGNLNFIYDGQVWVIICHKLYT